MECAQHQLTDSLAVQADFVRVDGKDENYLRNINLWVDCGNGQKGTYTGYLGPACIGRTLPVAQFGRPDPRFADANVAYSDGYSRYDALQVNVTKRFSQRHSYQVSYILSRTLSTNANVIENGKPPSAQYGTSAQQATSSQGLVVGNDERHRLTALGTLELPWGTQFSGVFFYSEGFAYKWTSGRDLDGDLSLADRALVDVNNLTGPQLPVNPGWTDPVYRLDMRLAKRVQIRGKLAAEGLVELFNVFNRRNYLVYNGNQRSLVFQQPLPTDNLGYQPRMAQLGFRLFW